MEVLVRGFRQQRVRVARQLRARRAQRDRSRVLQRAIRVVLIEKQVFAVRSAPEEPYDFVRETLDVAGERGGVERRRVR